MDFSRGGGGEETMTSNNKRYTVTEVRAYFLGKAIEAEEDGRKYDARSWLLTGTSMLAKDLQIHVHAYNLEKRLKDPERAAQSFVWMIRKFPGREEGTAELADAVRIHHLDKGKETEEQAFLFSVFQALPQDVQLEVLIQRTEQTKILFEKCQFTLLLVKLYPDTVHQHGADLLFSVLECKSDVHSTFRKLLVIDLVPAVLHLSKGLRASPHLMVLLNQCIEYYALTREEAATKEGLREWSERWDNLFSIADKVGSISSWAIAPFFTRSDHGTDLYQRIEAAVQHQHQYNITEVGYVSLLVFIRSIVTYGRLTEFISFRNGQKTNLQLVEVGNGSHTSSTSQVTVSPICSDDLITGILSHFNTATKVWSLLGTANGERVGNELRRIAIHSGLRLEDWEVFRRFSRDYEIYNRSNSVSVSGGSLIQAASLHCSGWNYGAAAETVITALLDCEKPMEDTDESPSELKLEGFFGPSSGRVHFISDHPLEVLHYAVAILVKCLDASLQSSRSQTADRVIGHLLTLLQLEWPNPTASLVFTKILSIIRGKGSFKYFSFAKYVFEQEFLEEFMATQNHEKVRLELFGGEAPNPTRRVSTRGLDKGAKDEFKQGMVEQMKRCGLVPIEAVIRNFIMENRGEIVGLVKGSL